MRVDSHGHVLVTVNDPGQPNGAGVDYPLEHFQAALGSGNFHYVATDKARPDWTPDPTAASLAIGSLPSNGQPISRRRSCAEADGFPGFLATMSDQQKHDFLRSL